MALRGQGERTYRARSDASTDLSPYLRGSEEEHHHITHTQPAAHTSTVTKPPERDTQIQKLLIEIPVFFILPSRHNSK